MKEQAKERKYSKEFVIKLGTLPQDKRQKEQGTPNRAPKDDSPKDNDGTAGGEANGGNRAPGRYVGLFEYDRMS